MTNTAPLSNTNTTTNPLANVAWDDVLETLEAQRCELFLGSGVYEAPGGGDMEKALCDWLDVDNLNIIN